MMDRASMLDEVFRRAEGIRHRQTRREARLLGVSVCGLALALLMMIGGFAVNGAAVRPTKLGAFLLGPETGGYVIVALIAFALGIILVLVTQWYRKTDTNQDHNDPQ